jgi:hypothetical protein
VTERNNYDGNFDPDIRFEDFSTDVMVKAVRVYGQYIRVLDGTWYLAVKGKANDDLAAACDRAVWDKMEIHDVEITRKLFNIRGSDVSAMLKCLQMSPWTWSSEHHFKLKDPNHGVWTVSCCPTLLALEKEGGGRERRICGLIETELLQTRARAVNPKMKAIPPLSPTPV